MERIMNREMDTLIAERVMRWYWDGDWGCLIPPEQIAKPSEMWSDWQDGFNTEDGFHRYREPIRENYVPGIRYNGDATKIILPDYSTDIADAWRVVERMTRIPHTIEEAKFAMNTQFALWFDNATLWAMTASEAAFAICQAALGIMQP